MTHRVQGNGPRVPVSRATEGEAGSVVGAELKAGAAGTPAEVIMSAIQELDNARSSAQRMERERRQAQRRERKEQLLEQRDAARLRMIGQVVSGTAQVLAGAVQVASAAQSASAEQKVQDGQERVAELNQQVGENQERLATLDPEVSSDQAEVRELSLKNSKLEKRVDAEEARIEQLRRQDDIRGRYYNGAVDGVRGVGQMGAAVFEDQAADADMRAGFREMAAEVYRDAADSQREAAQNAGKSMDRAMDAIKQINEARREAERAANRV